MASHTCRNDFLHKWIVYKKFQLKISILSKNDCSATWKLNTNQKIFTWDQLRNVQRYQKYVPIYQALFFNSFWPVQANSAYWFYLHTKKLVDDSENWFFFKIDYPKLHIDRDTYFKLMNVLFAIENLGLKMYLPAYSNYTPKAYRLLLPA